MIPMISILQYKYCSSPTYACSRNQIRYTRVNVLTTGAVNIKECLKPKIAISKESRLSASKLPSQRLYISKYSITVGEWTIYRLKVVEWNSIKAFDRITIHIHVYYHRLLWGDQLNMWSCAHMWNNKPIWAGYHAACMIWSSSNLLLHSSLKTGTPVIAFKEILMKKTENNMMKSQQWSLQSFDSALA